MIAPVMPDPARTARLAVRAIERMGVPFDLACALLADQLPVWAQRIASVDGADVQWIYELSAALSDLRAQPITAPRRPATRTDQNIERSMGELGYVWSVELGQFMPRGGDRG